MVSGSTHTVCSPGERRSFSTATQSAYVGALLRNRRVIIDQKTEKYANDNP